MNNADSVAGAGFQEFPKMLYHKGNGATQKIVNSQAEEDELGDDWIDAPTDPLAAAQ